MNTNKLLLRFQLFAASLGLVFAMTATPVFAKTPQEIASDLAGAISILQGMGATSPTTEQIDGVLGILAAAARDLLILRPGPEVLLQPGDRGILVELLQQQLFFDPAVTPAGEGPVTGFYGPLTEQAVTRFQASRGLLVSGIVDRATAAELIEAYGTNLQNLLPVRDETAPAALPPGIQAPNAPAPIGPSFVPPAPSGGESTPPGPGIGY